MSKSYKEELNLYKEQKNTPLQENDRTPKKAKKKTLKVKKANHKHIYEIPIIIKYQYIGTDIYYELAMKCNCGKIRLVSREDLDKIGISIFNTSLHPLRHCYPNAEIVDIGKMWPSDYVKQINRT